MGVTRRIHVSTSCGFSWVLFRSAAASQRVPPFTSIDGHLVLSASWQMLLERSHVTLVCMCAVRPWWWRGVASGRFVFSSQRAGCHGCGSVGVCPGWSCSKLHSTWLLPLCEQACTCLWKQPRGQLGSCLLQGQPAQAEEAGYQPATTVAWYSIQEHPERFWKIGLERRLFIIKGS